MASTGDLAERVHRDPEQVRAELLAWLPDAPPDEVVATRGQLVDIDAHVRRHQPAVLREVRRMARLTEWEMARRWPAKDSTGARGDDRPALALGSANANATQWQRVYAVGRLDRDVLMSLTEPGDLSQSAVIKRARLVAEEFVPPEETRRRLESYEKSFGVVYADPPWSYGNKHPQGRPDDHYVTMTLDDICALPVPAADNCVLYLWATAPLLVEALQVMSAWGFTYRTGMVWDKVHPGVGYWFRGQHEHLLVGIKGNVSPPDRKQRTPSIYVEKRGQHSVKPDAVADLIAGWFPDVPRLEMFGRKERPGWVVWGNNPNVRHDVVGLHAEPWDPYDPERTGQYDLLATGEEAS